ncbi:MAG: hypothetical protein HUU28_10345 [Planctomycetaceae bacterium]|nr:hypothetical protein [Planctomycetaceae bacterium]
MRRHPLLAALLPFALAACSSTQLRPASPDSAEQFERLKSLAGDWVALEGGEAPPGSIVRYEVTSAGSALVETLFVGTPNEMRTVYFLDRGQLVLVHYCAAGNQPRMRALPSTSPDELTFDFDGGSNVDLEHGLHMHAAKFRFSTDARLETEWTHWQDGKAGGTVKFVLARSWK